MAKSNLVNLDALIKREDFGITEEEEHFDSFDKLSLRDLSRGALIGPNLRKPDFQRETNHWTPSQVVSLLESFVSGDLIPAVILWKSPTFLFVIDGGHRLSAIKAWIEDDYGDGPLSYEYFGRVISPDQQRMAEKTRKLVDKHIGSFKRLEQQNEQLDLEAIERKRISRIISRGIQVQWVKGDADKAEHSFFKINTQGTPLDPIEELLLKNRNKPIPISARAVIRAGTGHNYWSYFEDEHKTKIVDYSKKFHKILFEPELRRPIKTLDLPLGGSKGIRDAIQILIDLMLISNRNQQGIPKLVSDQDDDVTGEHTIASLKRSLKLISRISGNDGGSLGLHPAVYFYGPSGRHSRAMFLGMATLLAKKLVNNDSSFFSKFTTSREMLEKILISRKDLIATILQKHISRKRNLIYAKLIDELVKLISEDIEITDSKIVEITELDGKIVVGDIASTEPQFNDETKSKTFLDRALESAIKCPICKGFLDPEKSVSYDHIIRQRENGTGNSENCQLTHPYCNQSVKN
ncbi:GmrSD restriction endonuclease domain-containing protein [Roseivirga sp.]|uniref:GmrSD restriction endonuclease domain-containing protein n=1 Tax=Roseivirga sp. TaxID=1964215 RepID=UPI002B268D3C|nr:DUF262 domain-containing protein [Roseivirga sp.]